MKRVELEVVPFGKVQTRLSGAANLRCPRQKNERIPLVLGAQPLERGEHLRFDRPRVRRRQVLQIDFELPAFRTKDRTIPQVSGDRFGIERGGHHHQFEIRSLALLEVPKQRQAQVAGQVTLVELVQDHESDLRNATIGKQLPFQHAFGDEAQARAGAGDFLEAYLVTHQTPEGLSHLLSHPPGCKPRWQSARLQDRDLLRAGKLRPKQRGRYPRRLPCSRRGDDHQALGSLQNGDDLRKQRINRQSGGHSWLGQRRPRSHAGSLIEQGVQRSRLAQICKRKGCSGRLEIARTESAGGHSQ